MVQVDDPDVARRPADGLSWYREPVENPYLVVLDEATRPWRTYGPVYTPLVPLVGPSANNALSMMPWLAWTLPPAGANAFQVNDFETVTITLPTPWAFWVSIWRL